MAILCGIMAAAALLSQAVLADAADGHSMNVAPGQSTFTAPVGYPTTAFSSYYPVPSGRQPQPALYDSVLNITFPRNLTNPDTIPDHDPDPVYLPQPVANLTMSEQEAVIESALSDISRIINGSYIESHCSKCVASLQVAQNAAQLAPSLVPDAMVSLCTSSGFHSASTCNEDFDARTFGAIWTQVLALADVGGRDGQAICNSLSSDFCDFPTVTPLDTTKLFPKPKLVNASRPKPSGERVKVLHMSDFHIDPRYKVGSEGNCTSGLCCRSNVENEDLSTGDISYPAPLYGYYQCDTPYDLGLAALQAVGPLTGTSKDNPLAWTIYTGDLVSHDPQTQLSRAYTEYAEDSIYTLFKKYLTGPVFPVLGNHDTNPEAIDAPHSMPGNLSMQMSWNYNHVAGLWKHEGWINEAAEQQARVHYGAYSVKNHYGLRMITFNTDFWYHSNYLNYINTSNPDVSGTFQFMIQELQAAEDAGERVWIFGHVLSGWNGEDPLNNPSDLFYQIVDRYSPHVIANIFFGHSHEDQVMIYYTNNGTKQNRETALNTGWIGPSITPLTNVNSGFRLYEVDTATFEILDAYTFYSDVQSFPALANATHGPVFQYEYSTRDAYGSAAGWPKDAPLNATFWHAVTEAMEEDESNELVSMFNTFQGKSSVRSPNCTNDACAEAKVCYMRSGSAALGQACPQGCLCKADEQGPALSEGDDELSGTEHASSAQEAEQLGGDEDQSVFHDEAEGYAEAYTTSEYVNTTERVEKELPADFKLQEQLNHPHIYPESALGHSLEPVHARYDGRDMPHFRIGDGDGKKRASESCRAVLQVETPYSVDMKILNANEEKVNVRFEAASQTPAICIEIDIAKKLNEYQIAAGKKYEPQHIRCWVFGNSIKLRGLPAQSHLEPTHSSLEWQFASNDDGRSNVLGHTIKLALAYQKLKDSIDAPVSHVMETSFDLWDDDEVLQKSHCINVQRTRPVWTGVDKDQIREWERVVLRGDAWEKGELSAGQIAAVTLLRAIHIDIFAIVRNGWIQFWEAVSEYMLGAMAASAKWGPFWQYFLQAWNERDKSLNHPELDLSKLRVPRHLVTRWKVLRDDRTSKVISAEPFEWARVAAFPIWPTDGAATFLLKLGENREIQKRKQLVEEALTKPRNTVLATFSELDGSNAAYHVDLRLPDVKLKPKEATSAEEVDVWSILPGEGESFKVTILEAEGLGSGGTFKGKFEDNLSPMAGALLSGTVKFAGTQHDASFQVPLNRELRVKLKLWTDKHAGTNKMNALETLSKGQKGQKRPSESGPDLPGLVFRTRAYTPNPGELARQIRGTAGLWGKMMANLNRKGQDGKAKHQLNEEQKRAVELMWSSKKGIVAIHGPPGTGKTRTVLAGVEGLILAGYRVAIVAHANSQVDNAMAVWQETCENDERKRFARARNGYFEPAALLDALMAQSKEDVELGDDQSLHASVDGAYGAGPVLAKRINQMSSISSEAEKQVRRYIRSLAAVKDAMDTGDQAQTERRHDELQRLEPSVLSDACKDIRVWFSTTNSSGHRMLSAYSKIDVIVVEEAGLSSTADLAVPLASFLDTAKLVVLAGDHQQQAPICTSSERNEAHPLMEVSRFGSLITDSRDRIDVVKLRTQYRGHPDIYQPLSDVFYADDKSQDGLIMAESTKVLQPKQKFIQRFMKDTFGGAYNGRMRCALSVDGDDAAHTQYGNGTSICNEVEIDYIVRWIKALIAYGTDFKEDGKEYTSIQLSDIGISSPYNGQCKALRSALEAEGLYNVAREDSVEVITANKVQGRQFPVHIISFAKHHATEAGDNYFIANRGQCNVQWSRAQLFQLQIGNIGPWAGLARHQAYQNNHKTKFYKYIDGLVQAGDVMSRRDWEAGLNGNPAEASSFKLPGSQGRNNRGGGRGGRGRGRARGRGGKR